MKGTGDHCDGWRSLPPRPVRLAAFVERSRAHLKTPCEQSTASMAKDKYHLNKLLKQEDLSGWAVDFSHFAGHAFGGVVFESRRLRWSHI